MNVLFLCWEYPPAGSGIGRYIAEISAALGAAGHRTVILTSRTAGQPETDNAANGVVLRLFDRPDIRSKRVARLAVDLAREHRADWIEGADHWGECASLLRLKNRPPVVVKMHYNDVLLTTRYAQAWYPWQRAMIDLACLRQWRSIRAERYSVEHADAVTAPCQRILDEASRQGLALPEPRAVAPNPIRPIPDWRNCEAPNPTLLMVGRMDIGKGLPYVRPLLEEVTGAFPEVRLEIAGGDSYARGLGSLRQWFERELGPVRARVILLGSLDQVELDAAYRRAWVVIVPSRWDTFPQVVLEAMARGKAIVASPHGGMPEMLAGTSNAIADPAAPAFAEAVLEFLRDPESRRRAGADGSDRSAQHYSPHVIADRYVTTVTALLAGKLAR